MLRVENYKNPRPRELFLRSKTPITTERWQEGFIKRNIAA